MAIEFELLTGAPAQACEVFRNDCESIWGIFDELRKDPGIPACDVTIIFADDFAPEVYKILERLNPGVDPARFTWKAERVSGRVVAKNLPMRPDYSEVAIVVDASLWHGLHPADLSRLTAYLLMAHEMAHPYIEQGRLAAGIPMDDNGTNGAAWTRRILNNVSAEYVADCLANTVMRVAMKVTDDDGNPLDLSSRELLGEPHYLPGLEDVLKSMHPAWANTVIKYRVGLTDLGTMWDSIRNSTTDVLTYLVHAQATSEKFDEDSNVLDRDVIRDLPAVRLYLCDAWNELLPLLRWTIDTTSPAAIANAYEELIRIGDPALWRMWGALGLTREDKEGDEWALWVADPACCE